LLVLPLALLWISLVVMLQSWNRTAYLWRYARDNEMTLAEVRRRARKVY
jgi:hypothetical protein